MIVRVENALGAVHAGAAFHSVAVGEEEHAGVGVDELSHGGPVVRDGGGVVDVGVESGPVDGLVEVGEAIVTDFEFEY